VKQDLPANALDRYRGCLLGLAVGDAVGTTLEFAAPGAFHPIDDMIGGGPFDLEPGQWTDDTSMALCLAESLMDRAGFDARDQMERYVRWWREGYLSSNGSCFDIGATVRAALERYERTGEPFAGSDHPRAAGNGSIMRLAPVVLYFAPRHEAALHWAAESSRTTHAARAAVDACRLLADRLLAALDGGTKEDVLFRPFRTVTGRPLVPEIQALADGAWRDKPRTAIHGGGYVVECLEAALWCMHRTDSFRDAVLMAANLGDDADTTAAVCGQLAGAYYGASGIPEEWIEKLAMRDRITHLAERLAAADPLPFTRCYWADPGRLLAGAYPGDRDLNRTRNKIRGLLRLGIRAVVNLMEADETDHSGNPFRPYDTVVATEAQALGLGINIPCLRSPIPDMGVPTLQHLGEILHTLDDLIATTGPTYVHCWGGRGRTGLVVGAYLIRHGHARADDFVQRIAALRAFDAGGHASPETPQQIDCVREFAAAGPYP